MLQVAKVFNRNLKPLTEEISSRLFLLWRKLEKNQVQSAEGHANSYRMEFRGFVSVIAVKLLPAEARSRREILKVQAGNNRALPAFLKHQRSPEHRISLQSGAFLFRAGFSFSFTTHKSTPDTEGALQGTGFVLSKAQEKTNSPQMVKVE